LIAAGALLLLDNMSVVDVGDFLSTYWPILFIRWGIAVIRRRTSPDGASTSHAVESSVFDDQHTDSTAEHLMYSNVFGDINIRVSSKSFRGGSVSAVFGDTNVDLGDAGLSDGEHTIRISGVFGDATVALPHDTAFAVSGSTVFGDVRVLDQKKAGFAPSMTYESPGYDAAAKKLRVYAQQVFGDVVVRN
jgi:predicted membrane protein